MSDTISVVCPTCRTKLKVGAKMAGKAVRCPKKNCGAAIQAPAKAPVKETFGLAEEAPPAPVAVDALKKKEVREEPCPELAEGEEPYLQVLTGGDCVFRMSLEDVREGLIQGTIGRHDEARWVDEVPAREDHDSPDEYRSAMKRWGRNASWQLIGEGLAKEEPTIRRLYERPTNPGEFVAKVVMAALFVPLALLGLVVLNNYHLAGAMAEAGEVPFVVTGEDVAAARNPRQLKSVLTEMALERSIKGALWFAPEGSAFLVKAVAYLLYLAALAAVVFGVGFVVGYVVWFLHPRLRPEHYRTAAPDNYLPPGE